MTVFIGTYRDQFVVELIYHVLVRHSPGSHLPILDERLIADLSTVHHRNYSDRGLRMHQTMTRCGWRPAWRLMREARPG